MAALVAYYSRADENYFGGTYRYIEKGNTEKVAEIIAELVGADLFKIEQKAPYSAEYDICIEQAKKDKQANARPELVGLPESIDEYDTIYLGYPNYWGTMPMAVYTFLDAFDFSGKTIRPFCTHEGSGLSGTEKHIAKECPKANVERGLAICGSDVDGCKSVVERWL